jgi:hypothetical protein
MLTSQNSGKYLTRTYERERELCAQNKDAYSAADQAFYDISGQSPGMGDRERMEETFKMDTDPIDPLSEPKEIDIRDVRKEIGR